MALVKDVSSFIDGVKMKVMKLGAKFDNTSLMADDEWYPQAVRPKIRMARWNWQDCLGKLKQIASDPIPGADRRFIILVNDDTQEIKSTTPGALIGMTILNPGEGLKPHRHNSFAIYHVIQGRGFDLIRDEADEEPTKVEWQKGDTFLCPAWAYHNHVNDGDEQAIILTVQDFPLLATQRSLIFEEPAGAENVRLITKNFVPHRDTAGSFKLDV